MVESHLAGCERCQREVALLRTMRDVTRQQQVNEFPQEFSWHRFRRDIRQHRPSSKTSGTHKWWQPAVGIAAAVIITLQTVVIFDLNRDTGTYEQSGYQYDSMVIQIRFNPLATEAQLREMLLRVDAEIVSGPSAAGLYRIRLSNQNNDTSAAEKIEALKNHNNELILYVGED
jgi:hypothetical protein